MTEPTQEGGAPESPSAADVTEGSPWATGAMADPNVPAGEAPAPGGEQPPPAQP